MLAEGRSGEKRKSDPGRLVPDPEEVLSQDLSDVPFAVSPLHQTPGQVRPLGSVLQALDGFVVGGDRHVVDVVQESVDGRQIDLLGVGMRIQRIPHGGGNLPGIGVLPGQAQIPVRVIGEEPGFHHVVQGLGIHPDYSSRKHKMSKRVRHVESDQRVTGYPQKTAGTRPG